MTPAAQLARFAREARPSEPNLDMMRLSLLDWVSVGCAGRDEPVARIIRNMVLTEGGQGPAHIFGDPTPQPPRATALVNGTISHALDYDDTHFAHIGHPSVAVLPAALALAESEARSGAEFLNAALLGVEASIRVGLWLGRSHYQAGFHQTATAGAFGAAVAAGLLLDLAEPQLETALNLVATRASGLKSQFGSMGKPYNAGIAAANGVEAAQLASLGMSAAPDGMGSLQGFGPTHHGALETAHLTPDGFWLFDQISHKFHACCHGTHAALEALAQIAPQVTGDIAEVEITTHPRWLSVCDIKSPRSGLEVKFSYAHTAAMALSGLSTAALDSFSDTVAADPNLQALAKRVTVTADAKMPETASHVRVQAANGAAEASCDLADPIPRSALTDKLRAKSAALIGSEAEKALWDAITKGADPSQIGAFLNGSQEVRS
ncbi:MAG: MmgE/PrpD family protein [Pseudomonadota bacterium]